jgi:hypothetical protein
MLKLIAQAAALAWQAPGLLVRFFTLRRVGAGTFRRELLEAGIPPEAADELTASYKTMIVPKLTHGLRLFK